MNNKIVIVVIIIIAISTIIAIWFKNKKESYSNIGYINNVGSLLDKNYEFVQSPDDQIPPSHYADIVDSGNHLEFINNADSDTYTLNVENQSNSERLHRNHDKSLMPRTSRNVTPYNIDVSDPTSHAYMVNPPRVQLRDPLKFLADPYRGDVPITYHPNISVVGKTRYGRDSLRLDGFFSPHYQALYNKYTGSGFKNMPVKIVNQETVMDNI